LEHVRPLFILSVAQQFKSTTIYFNTAFVQSDLPEPIYLEPPLGYTVNGEDRVYKVGKSLYGNVRAAKRWHKHLSAALVERMGFRRSSIDSCLYFHDNLIFAFYMDDGIIVCQNYEATQAFINELRACGFDLGIKGDYAGYLGVDVVTQPDGTLLLSQTGLIAEVLADFGLTDSISTKITPVPEILAPH
jgi:Reverse transcriptase (RNA-dependent DNA polymerase)